MSKETQKADVDRVLSFLEEKRVSGDALSPEDIGTLLSESRRAIVVVITEGSLLGVRYEDGQFSSCLNEKEMLEVGAAIKPMVEHGTYVEKPLTMGNA